METVMSSNSGLMRGKRGVILGVANMKRPDGPDIPLGNSPCRE
jgi:hypothetical protein